VTRRITVPWPDPRPLRGRSTPLRILAASDEADPFLDDERNREALGRVDLVVGCGDLSPDRIDFLGGAFSAPIVYVRGNHDRGGPWPNPPEAPVPSAGRDLRSFAPVPVLALPWPGRDVGPARRSDVSAWAQVVSLAGRWLVQPPGAPVIVVSHAPPLGANDNPADPFHRGFAAYRFLLDRLRPPLWLHGHAALAAAPSWHARYRSTTLVNVTGSVLVEIEPPTGT
jgi:uncharacterized protein